MTGGGKTSPDQIVTKLRRTEEQIAFIRRDAQGSGISMEATTIGFGFGLTPVRQVQTSFG